ncbi:MAG: ATP-binding protein [Deltaproteobacteria bacterium]|nr:ATP-binding protein [Deltaproteobacteria bacterium]
MVLLAGPRQVGKTTLARHLLGERGGTYFSWDRASDRKQALASAWPAAGGLVVLDELHKYRHWKRWLKGEYDTRPPGLSFLVTGSARMDVFRRGGDSLQGRYHHWRLHPFTVGELAGVPASIAQKPGEPIVIPGGDRADLVEALLRFSGFPEPLVAGSERVWRRWQKERVERFFLEDVRELESLRELGGIQALADLLPARVGSPLSANSLREDLDASHKAVSHWLDVLERLYFAFRIRPHATRTQRGLRKMPKLYLWDPTLVDDAGPRFENLVALHLLRLCHLLEDRDGHRVELCYLRDADGREVDFLVTSRGKPWFAVEAKLADQSPSPEFLTYRERLAIPQCFLVTRGGARDVVRDGVRCLPAGSFLAALP